MECKKSDTTERLKAGKQWLIAVLEHEWLPGIHCVCYAGFDSNSKQ